MNRAEIPLHAKWRDYFRPTGTQGCILPELGIEFGDRGGTNQARVPVFGHANTLLVINRSLALHECLKAEYTCIYRLFEPHLRMTGMR
jgi:hypothetical protein